MARTTHGLTGDNTSAHPLGGPGRAGPAPRRGPASNPSVASVARSSRALHDPSSQASGPVGRYSSVFASDVSSSGGEALRQASHNSAAAARGAGWVAPTPRYAGFLRRRMTMTSEEASGSGPDASEPDEGPVRKQVGPWGRGGRAVDRGK